jgi:hypothetical protein
MRDLEVDSSFQETENQMSHYFPRPARVAALAAALPALILSTACTVVSTQPHQVAASNPTVTYAYVGDSQLIDANQRAIRFCDPYQGTPHAVSVTDTGNGGRSATFECLKAPLPMEVLVPTRSYLTASYQTDQEFLDASRNARLFCLNAGMRGLTTSITPNPGGGNSVAFQCRPG